MTSEPTPETTAESPQELNERVQATLTQTATHYSSPASGDGLLSGIRNQFSSLTNSVSTWLQQRGIIGDVATGQTWLPRIFGGIAGIGAGLFSATVLQNWFKRIPLVGNLLSTAVGAVAGFVTHQAFSSITQRTVDQALPVGTGTVRVLSRPEIIHDVPFTSPRNDGNNAPLPPERRLIPTPIMSNLRAPGSWRQIMQLRRDVDNVSTQTLGVGTVQAATRDQILLQRAREGVARLQLNYQGWEETMHVLNDYTADYTNYIRPAAITDLQSLHLTPDEASSIVPRFPVIPTLHAPAEWNGWRGSNETSGGLDAQGPRAIRFLRTHVAGVGHLEESQWGSMNTSEKLNVLRRYRAEVTELAFTKLDGTKIANLGNPLASLDVVLSAQIASHFNLLGAHTNEGAAAQQFAKWLVEHNPSSRTTNFTPAEWNQFGTHIEDCIQQNVFNTEASRNKAQQMAEYAHYRAVVAPQMDRFETEVHNPNRQMLESMVADGGVLDRYNQQVAEFTQTMEIAEAQRIVIRRSSVLRSNPAAPGERHQLEVIDVRNQPPQRYRVDTGGNEYLVYINGGEAVHVPMAGLTNPFEQGNFEQVRIAIMPIIAQANQLKQVQRQSSAQLHWVRAEQNVTAEGTAAQEFIGLEGRLQGKVGRGITYAEMDTQLNTYLQNHVVYNTYHFVDTRNNPPQTVEIRNRVRSLMDHGAQDFEVRVNGGAWVAVHMNERETGLETNGMANRLASAQRILERANATSSSASLPLNDSNHSLNSDLTALAQLVNMPDGSLLAAPSTPEGITAMNTCRGNSL